MTDTSSEAFRQTCEARHVVALRRISRGRANEYLDQVAQKRGEPAAEALRSAAAAFWAERMNLTKATP